MSTIATSKSMIDIILLFTKIQGYYESTKFRDWYNKHFYDYQQLKAEKTPVQQNFINWLIEKHARKEGFDD